MLLYRIGYWTTGPGEVRGLPDPHDLVDPGWDPDDRFVVECYLGSDTYLRGYMGLSPCRICGEPNGSGELTDGLLAWPDGLAHYVRDHAVRLPAIIEAYILRRVERLETAVVDDLWWADGALDPVMTHANPTGPSDRAEGLAGVIEELRALVDSYGDAVPAEMTPQFFCHAFNEYDGAIRALLQGWDHVVHPEASSGEER